MMPIVAVDNFTLILESCSGDADMFVSQKSSLPNSQNADYVSDNIGEVCV
jgi:hypothetical protein